MSGERQIQLFAAGQGEEVDDRGLLHPPMTDEKP